MQRVFSFLCQRHTKGELFQRGATPIVSRKTVESLNMSCLGEAWFDSSARRESKERGSCSLCFLEEKTLSDTSAGRQETARPSGVMSLVGWLQSVWGVTGEIKSSVCLCVWVEEGVRGLNGLHALVLNRRSATLRHDWITLIQDYDPSDSAAGPPDCKDTKQSLLGFFFFSSVRLSLFLTRMRLTSLRKASQRKNASVYLTPRPFFFLPSRRRAFPGNVTCWSACRILELSVNGPQPKHAVMFSP